MRLSQKLAGVLRFEWQDDVMTPDGTDNAFARAAAKLEKENKHLKKELWIERAVHNRFRQEAHEHNGSSAVTLHQMHERYREMEKELQHWKANHDTMKAKLEFATQRTDLPADRIPAYVDMAKRVQRAEEEAEKLGRLVERYRLQLKHNSKETHHAL